MANKYLLKPVLKTAKQAFYLEDENGNAVYEGKMTKFSPSSSRSLTGKIRRPLESILC